MYILVDISTVYFTIRIIACTKILLSMRFKRSQIIIKYDARVNLFFYTLIHKLAHLLAEFP